MANALISTRYDVFISFRGADTRNSIASCLYEYLSLLKVRVFMDCQEFREESTGQKTRDAIRRSKLFLPVFSRGYASSRWCLEELACMVDCMKEFSGEKSMIPIFYDVDVRDVKLETYLYTNALIEHEKTCSSKTVDMWRQALIKASQMMGLSLSDVKGQGKLIKQITEHVSRSLMIKQTILPDHFVGIEEKVRDVIDMLDCGSTDVRVVVIHGMGGIGKTTLASAIFNKICWKFQGCSFLSNVRESLTVGNGFLDLQNKLLRDIPMLAPYPFPDADANWIWSKACFQSKKVLIILDDVSDVWQIKKIVGTGDWLGLGSRIIITTRNLSSVVTEKINFLDKSEKKICTYNMKELGLDSSLQLLCRHAFGQDSPPSGYEQLARGIISFTGGIPLAIEVIGSYLKRKTVAVWEGMLKKTNKVFDERLYQAMTPL